MSRASGLPVEYKFAIGVMALMLIALIASMRGCAATAPVQPEAKAKPQHLGDLPNAQPQGWAMSAQVIQPPGTVREWQAWLAAVNYLKSHDLAGAPNPAFDGSHEAQTIQEVGDGYTVHALVTAGGATTKWMITVKREDSGLDSGTSAARE